MSQMVGGKLRVLGLGNERKQVKLSIDRPEGSKWSFSGSVSAILKDKRKEIQEASLSLRVKINGKCQGVEMSLVPVFAGLFCSQQSQRVVKRFISSGKYCSVAVTQHTINDKTYKRDSYTNVTPKIISRLTWKLFNEKHHPICLLKERIIQYFYNCFKNKRGNPLFSVYEDLPPIVSVRQNFDSLLVPEDHISRTKSDCYYVNAEWMLRSHMTAHQSDLIKMGLNNFLMVGDVYRKDATDSCHYPVFHQLDGVRLLTSEEVFAEEDDGASQLEVREKENTKRMQEKQEVYTVAAVKKVEGELKGTLEGLVRDLFGDEVKFQWVEAHFPFTHPSWELFVYLDGKWLEVLGCGVIEHKILENGGCGNRIGWAFGLGLDRLAMIYYSVPDIRIFWSRDRAFLRQFEGKTWADRVTFKEFSAFPTCYFDLSFWLKGSFDANAFEEMVREHCGEELEHVELIDKYTNPKTGRESRCYRISYRSKEKTFTKQELRDTHESLTKKAEEQFNVEVR